MDALKILATITSSLLMTVMLSGCAALHHEPVPGAYPTPKNTPIMAGAGATLGAVAGASTHPSAVPVGAAIGGLAGSAVGAFTDRPNAILKRLADNGVNVVAIGQGLLLIISTDKCFEFGTSDITNRCDYILNNVAAVLKMTGNAPIKVSGYTDNNMAETIALRLSQQQADSVVAYLWAHGIPHERFYVKGYGSANPIATNYTSHGNGLNRRVEISVGG